MHSLSLLTGRNGDECNYFCPFPLVVAITGLLCSAGGVRVRVRASNSAYMSMVALVVDDSMLMRYTVCRFLEERGYTVESATNGKEALDALSRIQPTLIVTDMQMPKMTGSELITELKSRPETANIPIIIVASRSSGFDESEKRANFAIYKDVDIDAQLGKALDAIMGKTRRGRGAGK
jgi:CheY-like chemotaxis protein